MACFARLLSIPMEKRGDLFDTLCRNSPIKFRNTGGFHKFCKFTLGIDPASGNLQVILLLLQGVVDLVTDDRSACALVVVEVFSATPKYLKMQTAFPFGILIVQ